MPSRHPFGPKDLTGLMPKEQPQISEDEDRLVSLGPRDVADLKRLLAKLDPAGDVSMPSERAKGHSGNDDQSRTRRVRQLLDQRRKRIAIFGRQMFAEPAWEMLLLLYLSETGQRLTQSSLTELSGASRSTGMRWIEYLADHGLVVREDHPTDKRRNFVNLSEKGRDLLNLYLSETP